MQARQLLVEQVQRISGVPCFLLASLKLQHHQVSVIQHLIVFRVHPENNDVRPKFDELSMVEHVLAHDEDSHADVQRGRCQETWGVVTVERLNDDVY